MSQTSISVRQKKAGRTELDALRESKADGSYCSFEDVARACHKWLMQRDIGYRRQREALAAGKSSPTRGFAGY